MAAQDAQQEGDDHMLDLHQHADIVERMRTDLSILSQGLPILTSPSIDSTGGSSYELEPTSAGHAEQSQFGERVIWEQACITALDDLLFWACEVDSARDLIKIGGLPILASALHPFESDVKHLFSPQAKADSGKPITIKTPQSQALSQTHSQNQLGDPSAPNLSSLNSNTRALALVPSASSESGIAPASEASAAISARPSETGQEAPHSSKPFHIELPLSNEKETFSVRIPLSIKRVPLSEAEPLNSQAPGSAPVEAHDGLTWNCADSYTAHSESTKSWTGTGNVGKQSAPVLLDPFIQSIHLDTSPPALSRLLESGPLLAEQGSSSSPQVPSRIRELTCRLVGTMSQNCDAIQLHVLPFLKPLLRILVRPLGARASANQSEHSSLLNCPTSSFDLASLPEQISALFAISSLCRGLSQGRSALLAWRGASIFCETLSACACTYKSMYTCPDRKQAVETDEFEIQERLTLLNKFLTKLLFIMDVLASEEHSFRDELLESGAVSEMARVLCLLDAQKEPEGELEEIALAALYSLLRHEQVLPSEARPDAYRHPHQKHYAQDFFATEEGRSLKRWLSTRAQFFASHCDSQSFQTHCELLANLQVELEESRK